MTSSTTARAPLHHEAAERIASLAVRSPVTTWVGRRVLAALLARIAELEIARGALRRELDMLAARELENARLRSHAMLPRRKPADTEGAG